MTQRECATGQGFWRLVLCEKARAAGWQVRLVYVGLPRVEDSIDRVARARMGQVEILDPDILQQSPKPYAR